MALLETVLSGLKLDDGDSPLSPTTKENFRILLKSVYSGDAHLERSADGKVHVQNVSKRTVPLAHIDKSRANTIQIADNDKDVKVKVDVCIEILNYMKENRFPRGVVIDKTKIQVSSLGEYREGKEFIKLQEVLGHGACAGDIVVVKDKATDSEHALKTVMISNFSTNELKCWVDLGGSDSFPSLYVFYIIDNKIAFHMEKIEHGVVLDDIIQKHIWDLKDQQRELVRPFSFCIFHGILSAIKEMHDKNWTHRDLHSGNVMLTKDTMSLKILDFGTAQVLRQETGFDHDGLKNDILNAIRLFCGLYICEDFQKNFRLEKELKSGTYKEVISKANLLSPEDKEELIQLISMTYDITLDRTKAGYGDTSPILEHIEGKIYPAKKEEILKKAAAVLFPDFYSGSKDIAMHETHDTVDGPWDNSEDLDCLEAAAASVPDDFLARMRIRIDIN